MTEIKCPNCGSTNWKLSLIDGKLELSCEYSHYLAGCYLEKTFPLDSPIQSILDYINGEEDKLKCPECRG